MLYSGKQIVTRIRNHIKKRGGARRNWVVGVGKEPRARLFTEHGVPKVGGFWILMHAESGEVARKVRSFLVKKVGLSGELHAEDPTADFVYAYMKSKHTSP